jgi:hypothetical protein
MVPEKVKKCSLAHLSPLAWSKTQESYLKLQG